MRDGSTRPPVRRQSPMTNAQTVDGRAIDVTGVVLLGVLICVWAVSWPVMKIGVTSVQPLWFAFLRYLIAAPVLAITAASRRRLRIPPREDRRLIVTSAVLQLAGFSALTSIALTIVPPGHASVLAYSTPLWVVPLAAWQLKERVPARSRAGVIVGSFGIFVIAAPSLFAPPGGGAVADALLLGAAALWATAIVQVRGHRSYSTPLALAPWQALTAAVLLFPLALLIEGPPRPIGPVGEWTLLYAGLAATAFAYWAMGEVVRRFAATTTAMALLAVPCLGILASALFLGETIDRWLLCGAPMITLGIGLTAIRPSSGPDWRTRDR